MLSDLHDELSSEEISLMFARTKGPVRDTLDRAGLVRRFGVESFYSTLEGGVAAFTAGAASTTAYAVLARDQSSAITESDLDSHNST